MDVTPTTNQPQALFGPQEGILGKDDFLKILVTQLRNQDPLNPTKSEDFAVQLAQFSSVEQLQNINTALADNLEMDLLLNQAINNTLATTLIGKKVKALGNAISVGEGEDLLNYRLLSPAQKVTIEIADINGIVVRTVELDGQTGGDHSFKWDGKDESGDDVPEGVYRFSVKAEDASGNEVNSMTFISGVIHSIRYNNGNAMLLLGDVAVSLSDVFEIGLNPDGSDSQITRTSIGNDR